MPVYAPVLPVPPVLPFCRPSKHSNDTLLARTPSTVEKPTSLIRSTNTSSQTSTQVTHRLQGSLPTSKSLASLQESLCPSTCPYHSQESQMLPHTQSNMPLPHSSCLCSIQEASQRPNSSSSCNLLQAHSRCPSKSACIAGSFSTLGVSQTVPPILRSCREEAGMNYLDDTTVDDLAGYLDEIMFIPKPMSEMAELMYT